MRLYELEKGYKMVKGAPEYQPDGAKVSPFYQKELGPGWDQKSLDKDGDDIIPGSSKFFKSARADRMHLIVHQQQQILVAVDIQKLLELTKVPR